MTRRQFLKGAAITSLASAVAGSYARFVEPFWVDYENLPMPVRNLPASFKGFRITHLTDLHVTDPVSVAHHRRIIDRINSEKPDVVVVTGDLITAAVSKLGPVIELMSLLSPRVIVCLGNHDYSAYRNERDKVRAAADRPLVNGLRDVGCVVLRNDSYSIDRPDGRLWFVGLEDWAVGPFDADAALANVPAGESKIVLSHNPDSAKTLDRPNVDWILAGHTHGGQVRLPLYGAPVLPVANKQWDQGLFELQHARLYVSRGAGYLWQVRFNCRPQVVTFTLEPA
jgi:predicted MPP superfamily phosphohydrolase